MYYQPGQEIDKTSHKLPHWQQQEAWLFVTYRLADALPQTLLNKLSELREAWLQHNPKPWTDRQEDEYYQRFAQKADQWLDDGHGCCCLKEPKNSTLVAAAFHHFDKKRYLLDCFVVMPNHVHVLFTPFKNESLPGIIHSWKRYTAREINKLRQKEGSLWQPEYWDTLIRHEEHFKWARHYISENPKKLSPQSYHHYQRKAP